MRVLLVEDEERLAAAVAAGLSRAGFVVDAVGEAEDARAALAGVAYDAIVLDLGLPDADGMDVLRELRRSDRATPVLILTARDALADRVAGLDGGADDYLLKPFELPELVARLKALLRRPAGALGVRLEVGDIAFDVGSRHVEVRGRALALSRRELLLLENLMRRAGRVAPKDVLEERLYGFGEEVGSNSLEVLVHRLRKKLAEAGAVAAIHTVRGLGYLLAEEPPA